MLRDAPLAIGPHRRRHAARARPGRGWRARRCFCPDARVSSTFPSDAEGVSGPAHTLGARPSGVIASAAPRLLWRRPVGRPPALAGDGARPVRAAARVAGARARALCALLTGGWWLGGTALAVRIDVRGTGLARPWRCSWRGRRYGRATAVGCASCSARRPMCCARFRCTSSLFGKRQIEWVRTKRDGAGPELPTTSATRHVRTRTSTSAQGGAACSACRSMRSTSTKRSSACGATPLAAALFHLDAEPEFRGRCAHVMQRFAIRCCTAT